MKECFTAVVAVLSSIAFACHSAAESSVTTSNDSNSPLPRVLLIGDSISIGYTPHVAELLRDEAVVVHPAENCQSTATGLDRLHVWLGDDRWDVIHFNWGLHDLKYVAEHDTGRPVRLGTDGARQWVSVERYGAQLSLLAGRLQETGAKLIWCSTTPIPKGSRGRVAGDEVRYNSVAKQVMSEQGIRINDLWDFVDRPGGPQPLKRNVHFSDQGYRALASRVANEVRKQLSSASLPTEERRE